MALHRQRVRVGTKEDGSPQVKWTQGRSLDELNDNIVRTYVEYNLLDGLLSEEEKKALGNRLLGNAESDVSSADSDAVPSEVESSSYRAAEEAGAPQETPATGKSAITLREYAIPWFKTYKENKLRPTTLRGYRSNFRKHIFPALGHLHLDEITPDVLQKFMTDRQYLARNTLHSMMTLISEMLDYAVEDGLLPKNPAASKRLFNPSTKKERRRALTLEEIQDVIKQLYETDNLEHRRILALMLFTGMRRGEVLGLKWEDIDFEKGTISVNKAVSYSSNQPILSTTKTHNGIRTIPLNPQLKELLKPYGADGFIIGGDKPLTKMVYDRIFREIRNSFDLHGATAHVFRHTYLSMLNQAGVDPKTIQAIGGHGNFMLTYELYVHSNNDQIMDAGEKVNELLSS